MSDRKFPYFDWQLWGLYTGLLVAVLYFKLWPNLAPEQKAELCGDIVFASFMSAWIAAIAGKPAAKDGGKKLPAVPGDDAL